MRALLIPCVALCSLAVSGCHFAYSVHPLNTSEDAVKEPALVGQWKSADSADDQVCIQKGDKNTYTLVVADTDSNSASDVKPDSDSKPEKATKLVETFQITLVRLQDQLFADMVADQMAIDGSKVDLPVGTLNHHVILKLDLTDNDLVYAVLDPGAVREAVQQGNAPLKFEEIDDGVLLTSSTEDLRWSVSHYADRLFSDGGHYTRMPEDDAAPTPCSAIPPPASAPN